MNICLPKQYTQKFLQAVKDGTLDPDDLRLMTSEERNAALAHFVGEEAAPTVNALFEKKLILKHQQDAMINWVKEVGGLKPDVRRDLLTKIEKLDNVLNPEDKDAFLKELASKKLGTEVTYEEAQQISKLSKDVQQTKAAIKPEDPIGSPSRLAFGEKNVELQNYIKELKTRQNTTAENVKETLGQLKKNPVGTLGQGLSEIAGTAKGIKASLDNSAIFRQGWKTLFTNPKIWAKNAAESFINIKNQLGRKATDNTIIDGIKADIYSRPNALNNTYSKMKLDIGNMEEAFPTTLPEKIPLFNRLYKASEVAYTGFLYRMRADIADKMIAIAEQGGVDLTQKAELEQIGQLVNSLTGRGSLGEFEKVGKSINTIFFSPKMLMSNIDFLTGHNLRPGVTPFVRKQAAINLLKVTAGIATILGIAEALHPGSVEMDPRSADFGKIRIGDTRFDVSAGMGSLVTLAAREISQSTKSSTTHKVTKLGENKFGAKTGMDVLVDFGENKLAPAAAVMKDIISQRTFEGEKPTAEGEALNLLAPLPLQNAYEVWKNPNGADPVITILADALGIATNTYSPKKK